MATVEIRPAKSYAKLPGWRIPEARRWLVALCAASLLTGPVVFAQTAGTETPANVAVTPEDHEVETLLGQIEQQISAGHTMTPEDDNAMLSWRHLLERTSLASPSVQQALSDFAGRVQRRADDEQAAGDAIIASDFAVFAEQAIHLLDPEHTAKATLSKGPNNIPSETSTVASPPTDGTSVADTASSASPPVVFAPPQPKEVAPAPMEMAHGDEPATTPASPIPDASSDRAVKPVTPSESTAMPTMTPAPNVSGRTASDQAASAAFALRGDAMLAIKDISAARKFYEYAANAGNAQAALALGETYDAAFLSQLGTVGLKPNPGTAATWYRKAAALGSRVADGRLRALSAEAAK